ncbi:uncharacterized protein IWZ02DRAFT_37205 [Phyllosticta citriasiana]|uniref:uncharacterized protein n=1 Tax=Phyllosticta citriasiana TaxID=595635 RepID=UPI0030FDB999
MQVVLMDFDVIDKLPTPTDLRASQASFGMFGCMTSSGQVVFLDQGRTGQFRLYLSLREYSSNYFLLLPVEVTHFQQDRCPSQSRPKCSFPTQSTALQWIWVFHIQDHPILHHPSIFKQSYSIIQKSRAVRRRTGSRSFNTNMNFAHIPMSATDGRNRRWGGPRGTQINTQSFGDLTSRHGDYRHRPSYQPYDQSQRASRDRFNVSSNFVARNRPPDAPWPRGPLTSSENIPPSRPRAMEQHDNYRRPSALNTDHPGTNHLVSPFSQLCTLIPELNWEDLIPVSIKSDLDDTLNQARWVSCQIDCLMRLSVTNQFRAELYFTSLDHLSYQYEAFRLVRKALIHRQPDGQLLNHNHPHENGICPYLRTLHAYLTAFRTANQPTSIVSSSLRYRPDYPQAELDGPLHLQARMYNLRTVATTLVDDFESIENADEMARMVARLSAYTIDDEEWEESSRTIKMIREARQSRAHDERLQRSQSDPFGETSDHHDSSDIADATPLQDITHTNQSVPMFRWHSRRQHHSEILPAEPFYSQSQPFTIESLHPLPPPGRLPRHDYGPFEEQSIWTNNATAVNNRTSHTATTNDAFQMSGSGDNAPVQRSQGDYDAAVAHRDSFIGPTDTIELNRGTEPLSPLSLPRSRIWDPAGTTSSRHSRRDRPIRPRNVHEVGFWRANPSARRNGNATDPFHTTMPGHERSRYAPLPLNHPVPLRPRRQRRRSSSTSSSHTVRTVQVLSPGEARYVNAWKTSNWAARVGVGVEERRCLENEMQAAMDKIGAMPGVDRFEWEERALALRKRG